MQELSKKYKKKVMKYGMQCLWKRYLDTRSILDKKRSSRPEIVSPQSARTNKRIYTKSFIFCCKYGFQRRIWGRGWSGLKSVQLFWTVRTRSNHPIQGTKFPSVVMYQFTWKWKRKASIIEKFKNSKVNSCDAYQSNENAWITNIAFKNAIQIL